VPGIGYRHGSSGGCEIRSVEFSIHERGSIHCKFNLLNLDFMFIFITANNLRYFRYFQADVRGLARPRKGLLWKATGFYHCGKLGPCGPSFPQEVCRNVALQAATKTQTHSR
jgi:hypothetical protein